MSDSKKRNAYRPLPAVPTGYATYEFSGRPGPALLREAADWWEENKNTMVVVGVDTNISPSDPSWAPRILVTAFESSEDW